MYELKYAVTERDLKEASKAVNLRYVIIYLCIAAAGLAVGILSIVLSDSSFMHVTGIIVTVFGGLLLVLACLLAFIPQKAFDSVTETGDDEKEVSITHDNITVKNGETVKELSYCEMTAVKLRKRYIIAYFGKYSALIIKPNGNAKEIYEYIEKRQGRRKPESKINE